ncbi:AAA family ATPase [Caballeronia sp. 15711]|uniref:AAA family ATPase n=1 Tax=Caballeronia sp. 15711 TaxID=3391029 RepID=UPI0039E3D5AB
MTIKRLLLLSGPMRSGKSSVAQALKENHAFSGISSSGYLRGYAEQIGVIVERSQLQDLGDRLDFETDFAWVIDAVARPAVEAAPSTENWLLDAVRKARQVDHFRAQFHHLVKHVHLCAPEQILRTRYVAERSAADPDYGVAIAHPNEVAARSLCSIADEIYDTTQTLATDIAARIVDNWEV